jgi:tetratricopeptide (TPR) repeat protein
VAWGDWKDKEVSVTRWLGRAAAIADDLIRAEGLGEEVRFRLCVRALAASVALRGQIDPSEWAKQALAAGESMLKTTKDPVRQSQVQWELGTALYDALQVYQFRRDHETALKYGELAIQHLEGLDEEHRSPATAYLLGRLYFRVGAIHSVAKQDHRTAVTWFDKAVPLLSQPLLPQAHSELGRHGESFVSMGVSYWEIGQRERAIELTTRGVTLMEQAVEEGLLGKTALTVPYGNLAAMHRQLGSAEKAERYQQMATQLKDHKLR